MATNILSYGGGVQTIAMCVLVARGVLPRPDAVIAADTGREMPTTWEYAEAYARPLLASVGLELHIAPHSLANEDLHDGRGDLIIPIFTESGKFPGWCSSRWKARVVARYASRVLGLPTPRINWLGFSLDEKRRAQSQEPDRRYPLIELNLTRIDCERIITGFGFPVPPKSRCWMCPHQSNELWREVRKDLALWSQATALDAELREDGDKWYLHASRKPLCEADIDANDRAEPSRQCGLGLCFV